MAEVVLEMWKKAGVNAQLELIELSVRAQKNRDKAFKGAWWAEPGSTVQDPDGMMWRLLSPGGIMDYWRHEEWDRLGTEARFSMDQQLRDRDYKRMTEIMLEHFPWIPVIQPIEGYGVQNYISWKPYPNQSFQLRKENFRFNR